jgi:hypothetical protein
MAASIPATALAQPYDPGCVRSNQDNRVAGTVAGAVGGALIGGAIAGRHDRGAGVAIGGVTGALAGNAIAGANSHPCPSGYYYAPPPGRYDDGRYDNGGFWGGAPAGIHERIDFMQERINRASADGRLTRHETYASNHDLSIIRDQERRLRYRDGGRLRPEDRDYLQSQLDGLSQRIHWAARSGY